MVGRREERKVSGRRRRMELEEDRSFPFFFFSFFGGKGERERERGESGFGCLLWSIGTSGGGVFSSPTPSTFPHMHTRIEPVLVIFKF